MTRSLQLRVYPCILNTLLRFAFAAAPHCLLNLACKDNSPVHSTKGTPSHMNVLFIFPSWYWCTIGHIGVFSLTGWSRLLPTGFHVPRRTQDPARLASDFVYGSCTLFAVPFNALRLSFAHNFSRSFNPSPKTGLGCSDFARHYSRNHCCFLLLQVLRCFNSLGSLLWLYVFRQDA